MYMTSGAAQFCLAGHMRPVGRRLESPAIDDMVGNKEGNYFTGFV